MHKTKLTQDSVGGDGAKSVLMRYAVVALLAVGAKKYGFIDSAKLPSFLK